MPRGMLEVLLVSAKGLDDTDFLSNMNTYAVLTCRTQEKNSSVAKGQGSSPEWNETFLFTVSSGVTEIGIKIMDSDNFSIDDFVGEAIIPLEPVFVEEAMPPAAYNVVKDERYRGEIRVGLKFVPQENCKREFGDAENIGGWRESSFD
ncbi:16 kDa phloem protein 2-like [Primulina tabacum]|uniref:16 kDa phloem protein 2-like n=1 Tax=Primulina tabacum TaxID=48773 RepID=UPI003F5AA285